MTDLVIGFGEVGKALAHVLGERAEIAIHDPPKGYEAKNVRSLYDQNEEYPVSAPVEYEWMHIAYPWHKEFVTTTRGYMDTFRPKHVVIHSTVPVGTTSDLFSIMPPGFYSVTYSPVRGIHPHLARYLREFPKWYATDDSSEAKAVEELFHSCGMQTRRAPSYDALEWLKLMETTEYGYRIALWQEIERQAENLEWVNAMKDFLFEKRKVYDGDRGLAPIMYGGVIGGHCVMPNLELLRQSGMMSPQLYRWLKESNEMRKTELEL